MNDQKTRDFVVSPNVETHFSWMRTRMSIERTMLSWLRTATALIGFGFTIVQFFDRMKSMKGTRPPLFPDMPLYFGLALILCGVVSLLISLWQYRSTIGYLRQPAFAALTPAKHDQHQTPTSALAILLAVLGAATFTALLLRTL